MLLHPGAWAKAPLLGRIPALKLQAVHFIYGVSDWMRPENGRQVREAAAAAPGTPAVTVTVVQDAGHQVIIDQPAKFAAAVAAALDPTASCDDVDF